MASFILSLVYEALTLTGRDIDLKIVQMDKAY